MMIFYITPAIIRWNNNNRRKADVAAILQAVSDYRLQNSGNFPSSSSPLTKPGLKIYKNRSVYVPADSADPNPVTDTNKVYIYNNALCDTANPGKYIPGGSRDIVALYALDPSISQCRQL